MGPRLSLLGKFSVLSLVAMVLLAVSIGVVLRDRIEARALRKAEDVTRVANRLAIAPNLTRADLGGPLDRAGMLALDAAVRGSRRRG